MRRTPPVSPPHLPSLRPSPKLTTQPPACRPPLLNLGQQATLLFKLPRRVGQPLTPVVRLIWAQGDRRFESEPFVVPPPAAANPGQSLTAIITLRDNGTYAARFD